MIEFTTQECHEILGVIDDLSGGNAVNIFMWDGTDNPADPGIAAAVKLFKACGQAVPENLEDE